MELQFNVQMFLIVSAHCIFCIFFIQLKPQRQKKYTVFEGNAEEKRKAAEKEKEAKVLNKLVCK